MYTQLWKWTIIDSKSSRTIHISQNRKRKRTFSWMFVVFCLIFFAFASILARCKWPFTMKTSLTTKNTVEQGQHALASIARDASCTQHFRLFFLVECKTYSIFLILQHTCKTCPKQNYKFTSYRYLFVIREESSFTEMCVIWKLSACTKFAQYCVSYGRS